MDEAFGRLASGRLQDGACAADSGGQIGKNLIDGALRETDAQPKLNQLRLGDVVQVRLDGRAPPIAGTGTTSVAVTVSTPTTLNWSSVYQSGSSSEDRVAPAGTCWADALACRKLEPRLIRALCNSLASSELIGLSCP
jgi:hypothetical protein